MIYKPQVTEKLFEASKKKYEEILANGRKLKKDLDWVLDLYTHEDGETLWFIGEGDMDHEYANRSFLRFYCKKVFASGYPDFLKKVNEKFKSIKAINE